MTLRPPQQLPLWLPLLLLLATANAQNLTASGAVDVDTSTSPPTTSSISPPTPTGRVLQRMRASHRMGKDTYLEAYMDSHGNSHGNTHGNFQGEQQGYPVIQEQTNQVTPQDPGPSPAPAYATPSYAAPVTSYGSPSQAPSPNQVYGAPAPAPTRNYLPASSYGAPQATAPVYAAPTPVYGPPAPQPRPIYGPPSSPVFAPPPFFEGLSQGLSGLFMQFVHLLGSLPLPDMHTALKILLKVIIFKGAVKIASMVLLMLFLPKLEDIMTMVSSLMDMEMDAEKDKDKDKDKEKPEMEEHMDVMEAEQQAEEGSGRAIRLGRRAVRERQLRKLNALTARVEDSISRVAKSLRLRPV